MSTLDKAIRSPADTHYHSGGMMKNRYAAGIAAAVLAAGAASAGGAYAYTQQEHGAQPAPRQSAKVADIPLDTTARQLAAHKADTSETAMRRHAHNTAVKKAAKRRAAKRRAAAHRAAARRAARRAAQQRAGVPCRGDESAYEVTAPDGSCTGPWHHPGGVAPANPGLDCPSGAATSQACNDAIKGPGDSRNMQ